LSEAPQRVETQAIDLTPHSARIVRTSKKQAPSAPQDL